MLYEFVTANREEIIVRCKRKVAMRSAPKATDVEIEHGVPVFLDQLADVLRLGLTSNPLIVADATKHGYDLLRRGFTVSQVVHDYGDVCQAITEIAMERRAPISTSDFRLLNRCLDDAIAGAVTEFARDRDDPIEGRDAIDGLGTLAHELRDSLQTASVALQVIKSGRVGIAGSTGALLDRSLLGANDLIDRLLAEVNAARLGDLKES